MKKLFATSLFAASLLVFPASLFAQSDGSIAPQPAVMEERPQPTPTPSPALAPAPTSEPMPLEQVQEVLETVADEVPPTLQPWLYALAGALGAVVAMLGVQALMKKSAKQQAKKCAYCKGTGHEKDPACAECKGTGMVEEEKEVTAECPKCEGEGEVSCGPCKGEGGTVSMSCATCRGKGMKDCTACLGEGEASVTLKRDVPCPTCRKP